MKPAWSDPDFNVIGYLGDMLDTDNPKPAREQLNDAYAHNGGFSPMQGFKLIQGPLGSYALKYPGDPLQMEMSRTTLRDETIVLFEGAWVAVIQKDGSHVIARMD